MIVCEDDFQWTTVRILLWRVWGNHWITLTSHDESYAESLSDWSSVCNLTFTRILYGGFRTSGRYRDRQEDPRGRTNFVECCRDFVDVTKGSRATSTHWEECSATNIRKFFVHDRKHESARAAIIPVFRAFFILEILVWRVHKSSQSCHSVIPNNRCLFLKHTILETRKLMRRMIKGDVTSFWNRQNAIRQRNAMIFIFLQLRLKWVSVIDDSENLICRKILPIGWSPCYISSARRECKLEEALTEVYDMSFRKALFCRKIIDDGIWNADEIVSDDDSNMCRVLSSRS